MYSVIIRRSDFEEVYLILPSRLKMKGMGIQFFVLLLMVAGNLKICFDNP